MRLFSYLMLENQNVNEARSQVLLHGLFFSFKWSIGFPCNLAAGFVRLEIVKIDLDTLCQVLLHLYANCIRIILHKYSFVRFCYVEYVDYLIYGIWICVLDFQGFKFVTSFPHDLVLHVFHLCLPEFAFSSLMHNIWLVFSYALPLFYLSLLVVYLACIQIRLSKI